MSDWTFLIHAFAGLFAILNPVGAIPVYLALLPTDDARARRAIPRQATLTVVLTLLVFSFLGESVLRFFGISLAAFRTGGGILLLLMAISMLHGRTSAVKHLPEDSDEQDMGDSPAVVPLGIPMLVGPGSMSTALLLGQKADGAYQHIILIGVILALGVITFLLLGSAEALTKRLGGTGIRVMTRIMGLILAAIAMQFVGDGLAEMFPGLMRVAQ